MTTYGELTEEILSHLNGYGEVRDLVTSLSGAIDADDLTFQVADARQVNRGYIEIDSELLAVKSVDTSTNLVTLHPWGRGVRGTTAASHADGAMVTDTPRFPRSVVKNEINQQIRGLNGALFAVASDESNTASPAVVTYPIPADVKSIVRIQYQTVGPTRMWAPVARYKVDHEADTTAFPTGKSVDIYAGMAPGRTIKILYRREFGTLSAETDTFASVYLDENYRDILRDLVLSKLLAGQDAARIAVDSVESANRASTTQPLQATSLARSYFQSAQVRIAQERRRLLDLYPSTQVRMT